MKLDDKAIARIRQQREAVASASQAFAEAAFTRNALGLELKEAQERFDEAQQAEDRAAYTLRSVKASQNAEIRVLAARAGIEGDAVQLDLDAGTIEATP